MTACAPTTQPSAAAHAHAGHGPHAGCDGHAHAHAAQPAPSPGNDSFLSHNPCDGPEFSEVCACCQGAIDVDELMGLEAAHSHGEGASLSQGLGPRLPRGTADRLLAGLTVWATAPGLYFGVQNFRAAHKNIAILAQTSVALANPSCALDLRRASEAQAATGEDIGHNRAAYALTLSRSASMQRFIRMFAGAMPLFGSACMLGSVVMPTLSVVGSALMVLYCTSHICRYLGWEWRQVRALRQAARAYAAEHQLPQRGLAASQAQIAHRARLYPAVAAAFGLYGVGAGLLTAGALCAAPCLVAPGVCLLLPGLALVVYLNNGPIKAAFGHNQDAHVNRKYLGDKAAILARIGRIEMELDALGALKADLARAPVAASARWRGYAWGVAEGAALAVSYLTSFGICTFGAANLRHRRRRHHLAHVADPGGIHRQHLIRLVAEGADASTSGAPGAAAVHDALFALRYGRGELLQDQRAALLDHYHARLVLEQAPACSTA